MPDSTIKKIPDAVAAELLELARIATSEPWVIEEGPPKGKNWGSFTKPRRIDLNRTSWTNRDEAVTCRKCLAAMRSRR